ncbi:MAG: hypothetical protein N3E50_05675, partial [Candidatus Goldbacteria bacterium]|nr:hypothetical protein [Candidatus Goldiibacteriota bacterium]
TPSMTITITNTRTSTATLLPTQTFTITPTATATLIPDKEVLKIENVVIYPNPYNPVKEDLNINFEITQKCSIIKVRIYTAGYRLIKQITETGNYNSVKNTIKIEKRYLNNLTNGIYYFVVLVKNQNKEDASKPVILVILR